MNTPLSTQTNLHNLTWRGMTAASCALNDGRASRATEIGNECGRMRQSGGEWGATGSANIAFHACGNHASIHTGRRTSPPSRHRNLMNYAFERVYNEKSMNINTDCYHIYQQIFRKNM